MNWIDVEFEVPEDGEVVEVRIGRHHVMEMRYMADPECWIPCGGKIVSEGKYPHPINKWRRKNVVNDHRV